MRISIKIKVILVMLAFYPATAFAYVDPGILSVVTQGLFAFIAGGIVTWIVTPWQALKLFICKFFKKSSRAQNNGESKGE